MRRFVFFGLLALGGCADPHQPLSPDYGNAVAVNIAAQTVDPAPAMTEPVTTDGQRIGNALERYKTNKTYVPRLPLDTGRVHSVPPEEREP